MSDALLNLYRLLVQSQYLSYQENFEYATARQNWNRVKYSGDDIDIEDAINMIEYEWGYFSFGVGLRLGLSLSNDLHALTPES